MIQAQLKITGRVQGVFFRAQARDKAFDLGLTGYAQNLSDGCVEILVQGEKAQIEKFIDWCRQGPTSAKVESVNTTWQDPGEKLDEFLVKH